LTDLEGERLWSITLSDFTWGTQLCTQGVATGNLSAIDEAGQDMLAGTAELKQLQSLAGAQFAGLTSSS
jgi:hypothetical protein